MPFLNWCRDIQKICHDINFALKFGLGQFFVVTEQKLSRHNFIYAPIGLCRDIQTSYRDIFSEAQVCCLLRHRENMTQQTFSCLSILAPTLSRQKRKPVAIKSLFCLKFFAYSLAFNHSNQMPLCNKVFHLVHATPLTPA